MAKHEVIMRSTGIRRGEYGAWCVCGWGLDQTKTLRQVNAHVRFSEGGGRDSGNGANKSRPPDPHRPTAAANPAAPGPGVAKAEELARRAKGAKA